MKMIKEEHIYLCQLGFTRPTIVEHKNYKGEIEKVQTVNLSIEDLVKVWRKCFLIYPDEIILLHMKSIVYECCSKKYISNSSSIVELLRQEGVICLKGENNEEEI